MMNTAAEYHEIVFNLQIPSVSQKKGRLAGENLRLCKNKKSSWITAKLLHEREKIAPSSDNKRF